MSSDDEADDPDSSKINAYKFPRSSTYLENSFQSTNDNCLEYLSQIVSQIESPSDKYENSIDDKLHQYKLRQKGEANNISMNNIDCQGQEGLPLRIVTVRVARKKQADLIFKNCLVDTGCTHNLLSTNAYNLIKKGNPDIQLQLTNKIMSVAGSRENANNAIGDVKLQIKIKTVEGKVIFITTDFLVCNCINGYSCIIGAPLLNNPEVTEYVSPTMWSLYDQGKTFKIPLDDKSYDSFKSDVMSVKATSNEEIEEIFNSVPDYMKYNTTIDETNKTYSIDMSESKTRDLNFSDVRFGSIVNSHLRKRMIKTFEQFRHLLSVDDFDIGKCKLFTISYDMDIEKLKPQKMRILSDNRLEKLKEIVKKLEEADIVENYSDKCPLMISNVVLVEKTADKTKAGVFYSKHKDPVKPEHKKFRLTIDMTDFNRGLRNIIKVQLETPEAILRAVSNKVLSTLDLKQGFFNLTIDEESKQFSAFYVGSEIYTFKRLIQGAASAPQIFTYVMMMIFSKETFARVKRKLPSWLQKHINNIDSFESFVKFYIDDIFIFSENVEEHEAHIYMVFLALEFGGMKFSIHKCDFFTDGVKILGYHVDPKNAMIGIDQIKGSSILNWEKPNDLNVLQSRLFALRYWSRFIPYLNDISYPLTQLMRLKQFNWTQEHDNAWLKIKSLILTDLRLKIPQSSDKLVLFVDASKIAISAVLFVELKDNTLHPVGCFSKLLALSEVNRSIYLKEVFALVEALKHFRPYILNSNHPTTVFTDSLSIMYANRNKHINSSCNSLSVKLLEQLNELDIEIFNVPGTVNILADLFSRSLLSSRYIQGEFSLSKTDAQLLPPPLKRFIISSKDLRNSLLSNLPPESKDSHTIKLQKGQTVEEVYSDYTNVTPEERYLSGIRFIQGWNDPSIQNHELPLSSVIINKIGSNNIADLESDINSVINSIPTHELENSSNRTQCERKIAALQSDFILAHYFPNEIPRKIRSRIRQSFIDNIMKHRRSSNNDVGSKTVELNNIQFSTVQTNNFHCQEKREEIQIHFSKFNYNIIHKKPTVNGRNSITIYNPTQQLLPAHSTSLIDTNVSFNNPNLDVLIDSRLHQVQKERGLMLSCSHPNANQATYYIINTNSFDVIIDTNEPLIDLFLSTRLCPNILSRNIQDELKTSTALLFGQTGDISLPGPGKKFVHFGIELVELINTPVDDDKIIMNNFVFLNSLTVESSTAAVKGSEGESEDSLRIFSNFNDNDCELIDCQLDKLAKLNQNILMNGHLNLEMFRELQNDDIFCQNVMANIDKSKKFIIEKGILKKVTSNGGIERKCLVVPDLLIAGLIHYLHNKFIHTSITQTIKLFQTIFFHRHARRLISKYVMSCLTCMYIKKIPATKQSSAEQRTFNPTKPRQGYSIDIIPMPKHGRFNYFVLFTDIFSRYFIGIPIVNKASENVKKAILDVLASQGIPLYIFSDADTSIISAMKEICKIYPIDFTTAVPNSQFQNIVETNYKVIKSMIELYLIKNHKILKWADYLPLIIDTANKRIVNSVHLSRHEIHHNEISNPIFDIEDDLFSFKDSDKIKDLIMKRNSLKAKNVNNDKHNFKLGDIVYCPNRYKAPVGVSTLVNPNCNGPYKIVKLQNRNAYLRNLISDKYISEHITKLKRLNLSDFFVEIDGISNIGDFHPKDQKTLTTLFSDSKHDLDADGQVYKDEDGDGETHEYLRGLEEDGLDSLDGLFQSIESATGVEDIPTDSDGIYSTPRYNLRRRAV